MFCCAVPRVSGGTHFHKESGKWFNVKWFTSKDISCQGCHAEYLTSVRFKLYRKKAKSVSVHGNIPL